MTDRLTEIRLVARQDFLDFIRDRAAVRSLIRLPLLMVGLVIVMGVVSFISAGGRQKDITEGIRRMTAGRTAVLTTMETGGDDPTVAVAGVDENHPLAHVLIERGMTIVATDDARRAVRHGDADAGLIVTEHGTPAAQVIVEDGDGGRRDAVLIQGALDRHAVLAGQQRATEAGLPSELVAPFEVEVRVQTTTSTTPSERGALGGLAIFAIFPLISLIVTTSSRISGARDRRVIEPLLVLPIRRSSVLIGKGVSAAGIGALSIAGPFAPLLLLAAVPAAATGLTAAWARLVLGLTIGLGGMCLVTVGYGLFSGARARSTGSPALVNRSILFLIPLVMVSANLLSQLSWAVPTLLIVPVVGTILFISHAITEGTNVLDAFVLLLSSAAIASGLVAAGARALERDVVILRATS